MIRYVCGFMLSPDKKLVALILKEQPKWQRGSWNGIGGKVELEDESDEHAMSREFYQEAGVLCTPNCWTEIVTLRGDDWEVVYFYHISPLVIQCKTAEKELVQLFETADLPKSVIFNLRWLIPLAMDDNVMKPLGLRGIPLTDAPLGGKLVPK